MPFEFKRLEIEDIILVEPKVFGDNRGFFMEAYKKYIHVDSPVYVERKTVSPFDAVEVIYDAGGLPVIAHPYDIDIAEDLIKKLSIMMERN